MSFPAILVCRRLSAGNLYSCIIHGVLITSVAFRKQNASDLLNPTVRPLNLMGLSALVAFQYPSPADRLGRSPFGYFRSLGVKKYHAFSRCCLKFAANQQKSLGHSWYIWKHPSINHGSSYLIFTVSSNHWKSESFNFAVLVSVSTTKFSIQTMGIFITN